jgi:hypothetical protein
MSPGRGDDTVFDHPTEKCGVVGVSRADPAPPPATDNAR